MEENDIHVIYPNLDLFVKSKENLNILTQKHDHMCPNELRIQKKMQVKFKSYEICQYFMISHVKAIVKI
jgi:hypothetical protein